MSAFLLLAGWFVLRVPALPVVQTLQGASMGTTWSLQYWREAAPAPALQQTLAVTLARLDKGIFSTYAPESELSRLNRAPGGAALVLSPELYEVLTLARQVYLQSNGAFDVTIGPLVRLWGFGPDAAGPVPTAEAIAAAQARLGMSRVHLEVAGMVWREADIELDLSGIAKGYAVDVIAAQLQQQGIDNYLFELGGEIRVAGTHPGGSPWRIAIERPGTGVPQPYAVLSTQGQALALAGSGSYRNYRELEGLHFSHELDPRTGHPIRHALEAVTVVADSAALADAWATALIVLGPTEGLQTADSLGLSAHFIVHTNHGFAMQSSQRFKERFPSLDPI